MKVSSPKEVVSPKEVASSRSSEAVSSVRAEPTAAASPPRQVVEAPAADTTLANMVKETTQRDEADHAARLMSVAMALQSGRYSVDLMRIATALMRQ